MLKKVKELHHSEKGIVTLVIDEESGLNYIQKELRGSHPVYEQLKELSHPYLPKLKKVEQTAGGMFVLEEYIEGANLAEITLPEQQILSLMEELCEVLVFLHRNGIIHRDIKPSNLLLAPDGHIRLIDFDAARKEKSIGDSDTRLLGTRGYAPPEQYGFAQTDARADIYSVGVTMKQLLGKRAEKRPYRHIIRKCTEFAPKRRYATAKALLRALKARKLRLLLPWLLIFALLTGAGTFAWWFQNNAAEITEASYPDEPLLFYAPSEDYLIAKAGDLRKNNQQLTMKVDIDGDNTKETVRLYADSSGVICGEFISGIPLKDGKYAGMEFLSFMAVDIPLADYLTNVTSTSLFANEESMGDMAPIIRLEETPDGKQTLIYMGDPLQTAITIPDEVYIQVSCLDLNPESRDGKELIVSVGDLNTESVSAVYAYVGTAEMPAEYRGRMWGAGNIKLMPEGYLDAELLDNPYQGQNTYYYASNGIGIYSEADFTDYRYAVEGNLSLEEWHNAFASW